MIAFNYWFFIYWLLVSVLLVLVLLLVSFFLSTRAATGEKLTAYECGFDAFSDTRYAFDVHFFRISLLYLLFDLEIIFFFPLVMVVQSLDIYCFLNVFYFITIVILGFIYEWKTGALVWTQR